MNGELDLIGFGSVLTDDWETAKSQDNLVTESVPTTSYTTLIFNTQKEYLTQEVRQALNMAINRDVLVNGLLMGEGTPIMTPIAPVSPYYNDKVQVQYDPEKAKEMLAEAGWTDTEIFHLLWKQHYREMCSPDRTGFCKCRCKCRN